MRFYNLVHHWLVEHAAVKDTDDHERFRREMDDRFLGYITADGSIGAEVAPIDDIPRPSWFNPSELTLSDVSIIGAAAKGVMK